jgi:hypothetical protein
MLHGWTLVHAVHVDTLPQSHTHTTRHAADSPARQREHTQRRRYILFPLVLMLKPTFLPRRTYYYERLSTPDRATRPPPQPGSAARRATLTAHTTQACCMQLQQANAPTAALRKRVRRGEKQQSEAAPEPSVGGGGEGAGPETSATAVGRITWREGAARCRRSRLRTSGSSRRRRPGSQSQTRPQTP